MDLVISKGSNPFSAYMEMHRYDYSTNNKVGFFFELRNRLRSFF